jgi:hypothetical protein
MRDMKGIFALLAIPLTTLHAGSALRIPATGVYLGVWANQSSAANQEAAI